MIEDIKNSYSFYIESRKTFKEKENALFTISSKEEWIGLLVDRSVFLRGSYQTNIENIDKYINPFIDGKIALTDEIAECFLACVSNLIAQGLKDMLFGVDVLNLVKDYYLKRQNMDKYIYCLFQLAALKIDSPNQDEVKQAYNFYQEIKALRDKYLTFNDDLSRKIIILAHINLMLSAVMLSEESITDLYTDFISYLNNDYINKENNQGLDKTLIVTQYSMILKKIIPIYVEKPTSAELRWVDETFNISSNQAPEYTNIADFNLYIWYLHNTKALSSLAALDLLYDYYRKNNKKIDYNNLNYSNTEEYGVQMFLMNTILKYLVIVKKEGNSSAKEYKLIKSKVKRDFDELVKSTPYLTNNNVIDGTLAQDLNLVIQVIDDEKSVISNINDVLLKRNVMTLIHSIMVSKIAVVILDEIIDKNPEILVGILELNDINSIINNKDMLDEYITNAAYLHDIGKTMISDVINLQNRKISNKEFDLIKKHPDFGYSMIAETIIAKKYGDFIRYHHRLYDGTGGFPSEYNPLDLKSKVAVDLITICDSIDAATDILGRNYTNAKVFNPTILNELIEGSNTRYNGAIVNFIKCNSNLIDRLNKLTSTDRLDIYYSIFNEYLNE